MSSGSLGCGAGLRSVLALQKAASVSRIVRRGRTGHDHREGCVLWKLTPDRELAEYLAVLTTTTATTTKAATKDNNEKVTTMEGGHPEAKCGGGGGYGGGYLRACLARQCRVVERPHGEDHLARALPQAPPRVVVAIEGDGDRLIVNKPCRKLVEERVTGDIST